MRSHCDIYDVCCSYLKKPLWHLSLFDVCCWCWDWCCDICRGEMTTPSVVTFVTFVEPTPHKHRPHSWCRRPMQLFVFSSDSFITIFLWWKIWTSFLFVMLLMLLYIGQSIRLMYLLYTSLSNIGISYQVLSTYAHCHYFTALLRLIQTWMAWSWHRCWNHHRVNYTPYYKSHKYTIF